MITVMCGEDVDFCSVAITSAFAAANVKEYSEDCEPFLPLLFVLIALS